MMMIIIIECPILLVLPEPEEMTRISASREMTETLIFRSEYSCSCERER
jgi:hypothetical protein